MISIWHLKLDDSKDRTYRTQYSVNEQVRNSNKKIKASGPDGDRIERMLSLDLQAAYVYV